MKDIYHLLPKYFSGECSKEESKAIEDWQKTNNSEFEDMKNIWKLTEGHQYIEFDSKQGWEEISPKLQSTSRFSWLSMAASVAVLITLVASYFMFFNDNSDVSTTEMIAYTAVEQQKELLLADGSTVVLHKGSTLKYPKSFEGQNTRNVILEGEAYFNVAKKTETFIIDAGKTQIKVVGTAFNLKMTKEKTILSVTEGIVECAVAQQTQKITAGQEAIVENDKIKTNLIGNPNYMAWKTGVFVFEDSPLLLVINDLKSYYTAKLDLADGSQFDCQINATFEKEKISIILELISATCGLKIETIKQGQHYIITN